MALVEGCRHSLEISIPVEEVESETSRVTAEVQKRAKLPGFRPGKAPASLIRKQFAGDIRQQVLESLIPKLPAEAVRGGEPQRGRPARYHRRAFSRWRAADASRPKFEVVPQIELEEYNDVEVPYHDPEVTDEDVDKRMDELRETEGRVRERRSAAGGRRRSRGGGAGKRGGRGRRAGQAGRNGARNRRRRHLRGFHRESAAGSRRATRRNSRSPIRKTTAPPGWPARP